MSCDLFSPTIPMDITDEIKRQFRIPRSKNKLTLNELKRKVDATRIETYIPKDYYANERAIISYEGYRKQMLEVNNPKTKALKVVYENQTKCKIEENAMLEERLKTDYYMREVLDGFRKDCPNVYCSCPNCKKIDNIIRTRKIEKAKETIDRNTQWLKYHRHH